MNLATVGSPGLCQSGEAAAAVRAAVEKLQPEPEAQLPADHVDVSIYSII